MRVFEIKIEKQMGLNIIIKILDFLNIIWKTLIWE